MYRAPENRNMKRFDIIKTIQLVITIVLAGAAMLLIFRDAKLYHMIAADSHIRLLGIILWILLAVSFVFLFYDFNSYADLKRENSELDNAIYADALTGIANRYSVDVYLGQFLNQPLPPDMGCITIDLTNLAEINEHCGHAGGDAAIQVFSDILQNAASGVCFIGRNGGNKFVAIFRECSQKRLEAFLQSVREQTDAHNQQAPEKAVRYCAGTAFDEGDRVQTLTELVALSDRRAWKKMHEGEIQ